VAAGRIIDRPAPGRLDVADYGIRYVFAAFAVIALIGGLVVLAFGIETKGRVLEELSP